MTEHPSHKEARETPELPQPRPISRRRLLAFGALGTVAALGQAAARWARAAERDPAGGGVPLYYRHAMPAGHDHSVASGAPSAARAGFPDGIGPRILDHDAGRILTDFDYGIRVTSLPDGRKLREYALVALDASIEVAPGVAFPGWTYNGSAPGPTIRATEGDVVRVYFANGSAHPHTIHFHGIHAAEMDGVFEQVAPGETFTYEFTAEPAGLHLYHCHTMPLKRHVHKGLYGAFIVDPPEPLPPARELVMVMNGFDLDGDGENEFYAVNGQAFYYQDHPIRLRVGEPVRIYLVNVTEFDLINSLHVHANFFRFYRTGTRRDVWDYTDTVMLCQGERGILELAYQFPGKFLFHAHQSEFAELGWTGIFLVEG